MNTRRCVTFGTCGLNSTALCIASTAVTSAVVSPLLLAISGENLCGIRTTSHHNSFNNFSTKGKNQCKEKHCTWPYSSGIRCILKLQIKTPLLILNTYHCPRQTLDDDYNKLKTSLFCGIIYSHSLMQVRVAFHGTLRMSNFTYVGVSLNSIQFLDLMCRKKSEKCASKCTTKRLRKVPVQKTI
jgi:hypothetical protein